MAKYDLDLDYAVPTIDISLEELNEIIEEADSIIAGKGASPDKLTIAYLKKAQCLYKLAQVNSFSDKEELYKAKELLEKTLELTPDMPEALMRLGTVYSDLSEDGEDYFDEAVTMQKQTKIENKINSVADKNILSDEDLIKKWKNDPSVGHFKVDDDMEKVADFLLKGLI